MQAAERMAGDPPLNQVVTKTLEVGVRGYAPGGLQWNLGVFRADNHDDILFVADNQAGFGYFKNFGKTRRQGVEAGVERPSRHRELRRELHLSRRNLSKRPKPSTARATAATMGPAPGFEGNITCSPATGSRSFRSNLGKAYADFAITPQVSLDVDMQAASGSYARGNENNQHQPDGVYYLGPGKTPGYAVFNLGADYRPMPGLRFFLQVNNLFNTQYYTAAQLGATGFTNDGNFIARPFASPVIGGERPLVNATFFAPGAERMIWAGVRYAFGLPRP